MSALDDATYKTFKVRLRFGPEFPTEYDEAHIEGAFCLTIEASAVVISKTRELAVEYIEGFMGSANFEVVE